MNWCRCRQPVHGVMWHLCLFLRNFYFLYWTRIKIYFELWMRVRCGSIYFGQITHQNNVVALRVSSYRIKVPRTVKKNRSLRWKACGMKKRTRNQYNQMLNASKLPLDFDWIRFEELNIGKWQSTNATITTSISLWLKFPAAKGELNWLEEVVKRKCRKTNNKISTWMVG